MDKYEIHQASGEHVGHVAHNMRKEDQDEIYFSSGMSPFQALERGLRDSDQSYTVIFEDEPVMMFGVARSSMLEDRGTVWMLSTDRFDELRHHLTDMELIQAMITHLARDYSVLENWVHADNTPSLRWLRFLGFTIEEATPMGLFGKPFHHFWLRVH